MMQHSARILQSFYQLKNTENFDDVPFETLNLMFFLERGSWNGAQKQNHF